MTKKPRKLPANLSHLQRLATAAAADASLPVSRYRRWINTQIISAVLDRARDSDSEPLFALKGGAAMELRLGIAARASKDYDAAFRDRAERMLDVLDEALSGDWQGFQLRRTEPVSIGTTHAMRMDIRLSYKGKPWGTVQLEVAPAEGAAGREIDRVLAYSLDPVQVAGPERIACVSLRYQIAQKIHACTEVFESGRENDRFRDLVDLQLLRGLLGQDALPAVREACVEIFDLRRKHAWPPEVTVYQSWRDPFAAMAGEIGFYTEDLDVAATDLRDFISEIDGA